MPNLIIIAGPNGAGKSTMAPFILNDAVNIDNFVNADVIAQGICGFNPEKEAIQAGRIMVKRIKQLAVENKDFAFETTLSTRSFSTWIPKLIAEGYYVHLVFLWLKDVELAVSRVKERIKIGGHAVPEATVRRRYFSGVRNFFNLYMNIVSSWQFYNNSKMDNLYPIASGSGDDIIVDKHDLWLSLVEQNNEQIKEQNS